LHPSLAGNNREEAWGMGIQDGETVQEYSTPNKLTVPKIEKLLYHFMPNNFRQASYVSIGYSDL